MKYYYVEITEFLKRKVVIAAESAEQAQKIVDEMYEGGEILLDYGDFSGSEIGEARVASLEEIQGYCISDTEEN